MSSVKGCKRCKYDKTIYHIDYEKSAQEQMIYFTTDIVCSKCNYNPKSKRKHYYPVYRDYCKIPLDKVTDDMNVDLSKIIHEHNHNKCSWWSPNEKNIYDKEHNCIETLLIKNYVCDFCGKKSDYEEIIKRCKHTYDKFKYEIDYSESAKKQKICYTEHKVCSKCNYVNLNYKHKEAELNNYPNDMNVDLTKIIHKCNYDKVDYYKVPQYNYESKCIELILYTYYYCSICDKEMSDKKEIYNLNNPCKMMDELTKEYKNGNYCKEAIKQHNELIKWNEKHTTNWKRRKEARHEGDLRRYCEWWRNNHHDCGCCDNDYESGASYDRKGGHYYTYHGEWISGY